MFTFLKNALLVVLPKLPLIVAISVTEKYQWISKLYLHHDHLLWEVDYLEFQAFHKEVIVLSLILNLLLSIY